MKKISFATCVLLVLLSFGVGSVMATPVTFSESYLEGDSHYKLYEGYSLEFNFNLSALGGRANLIDEHGVTLGYRNPTTDETTYNPALYQTPFSAVLNFRFSSEDPSEETIKIYAGINDGNKTLKTTTYDLGYWSWKSFDYVREYADLSIDLGALGLLDYLADGSFLTIAFAPDYRSWFLNNDLRIDYANLTAQANPVPEPSALLLLGVGLIGIASCGRKRMS